eukprot:2578215-Amphidinium_carterae.1
METTEIANRLFLKKGPLPYVILGFPNAFAREDLLGPCHTSPTAMKIVGTCKVIHRNKSERRKGRYS